MRESHARRGRGAVLVGARVVGGTAGIAVAALAVGAAVLVPLPTIGGDVRATVVEPVAADQERVCAGPLLRLGDERGIDAVPNPVGAPDVRYAATEGVPRAERLNAVDWSVGSGPERIALAPSGADLPHLAASQVQPVAQGGLLGLAAAQCDSPASEAWLVGASTTTGRTAILTLANPSTVAATVDLGLYTEAGPVTAAGSQGIVVPPRSQRVLSLAGLIPDAVSPAVRVSARGGSIVAHLQQSITRTLEPGGVEIIGTAPSPSTRVIIPGYTIADHERVEEVGLGPGFEDLTSIIRVLVPGEDDARVLVSMIPEGGDGAAAPAVIQLDAGRVTDLTIDHPADGTYTVVLDANVPVLAAARSSVAIDGVIDVAWFGAAPAVYERALVSVASGPDPVLHIVNSSTADAAVTLAAGAGTTTELAIRAGGAASVPVTGGLTYVLEGFDELRLALVYRDETGLASFTVSGPSALAGDITIAR